MLSKEQIRVVSNILLDLGQISVASVVLPFVVPDFHDDAWPTIVSGSLLASLFWFLSILSAKKAETI